MIFADIELKINSPKGNEILLLKRDPQDKEDSEEFSKTAKTILVIGVFHGDEPDGEYLINRYLQERSDTKNRLLFIPCLNPDGKNANTRKNSNGVDLNRNFPTTNWEKLPSNDDYFGGEKPASEVEAQFLVYIIERYKPDLIITLHEPYKVVNYDGPAKETAQRISEITGYKVEESIGYPTPGSFGTYCGIEKGIQTITLELPEKEEKELLWNTNKDIFTYIQEWC